jgi:hypothetical protein
MAKNSSKSGDFGAFSSQKSFVMSHSGISFLLSKGYFALYWKFSERWWLI